MLSLKLIKNQRLIILFFLAVVIIGTAFSIYYVNNLNNSSQVASKTNLKDYDKLKQKISLVSDTKASQTPDYQKMIGYIQKLENSKLSKDEQREILYTALARLVEAYSANNDHRLYTLQIDLHDFIILNFPEDKKNNFIPLCLDPECADEPSNEVLNIIEEIRASSLPGHIKENDIKNLTNFNYLTDDNAQLKVVNFLIVADMVKGDPDYIKLGINLKIYNEIIDFLKNKYPSVYEETIKALPTPTK